MPRVKYDFLYVTTALGCSKAIPLYRKEGPRRLAEDPREVMALMKANESGGFIQAILPGLSPTLGRPARKRPELPINMVALAGPLERPCGVPQQWELFPFKFERIPELGVGS